MSAQLKIAKELSLPLDAVTQKLAWLGRTGSGKTYGCKRFVEQALRAGAQVVILDPVGVWAGLRLGPKAFDVPVLGGLFGDIPLEPTAGELVADLVVDHGSSMVLDVSQMTDADRRRFAQPFAERFFQRKKAAPSAVHLVLEECQEFVAQNPQAGEERMLHEFQRISKLGRNFGIGVSLISQRPQEVNKKALNQTECVFAFQLTGPQERKALDYWLSDKGLDGGKLGHLLPHLEVGAPHVWSPGWLKVSKVVHILPIDTLDTSQTPKVGEKSFRQRTLEPIDLKALGAAMASAVAKKQATDPKVLLARIAELEKQAGKPAAAPAPERVEVPMFDAEAFADLERGLSQEIVESIDRLRLALGNSKGKLHTYKSKCLESNGAKAGLGGAPRTVKAASAPAAQHRAAAATPSRQNGTSHSGAAADASLGKGELAVLIAVAQHRDGVTREQITVLTGYKRSTRDAYLQRLRAAGHVEESGGRIHGTNGGRHALGSSWQPLPTGAALREHWLERLPEGERAVLEVAIAAHPDWVTREAISEASGYKRSTRDAYIQRLRTRRLLADAERGGVKASDELF